MDTVDNIPLNIPEAGKNRIKDEQDVGKIAAFCIQTQVFS